MNFLITLFEKKKKIIRFVAAGGVAAAVNLGLLYFLTDIGGLWYLFSSIFSFAAATLVSFGLQKFWTFGNINREILGRQLFFYSAIAVFNLLVNAGLMYVLVDWRGLSYLLAQFFVIGLIAAWNFAICDFLIFKPE